jgi:mRNA interferase MazF
MGKPLIGEVVVVPFPQTDLQPGKRRPALVVVDLPGDDLILCQITSRFRDDGFSLPLTTADFTHGRLTQDSFIRSNRLFTIEQSVIHYVVGRISQSKLNEAKAKICQLFS